MFFSKQVIVFENFHLELSLSTFSIQGVCKIREFRKKSGKWVIFLKYQVKNKTIWCILENIREISVNMFVSVSSINLVPSTLEKIARKQIMLITELLVFIFHDRNSVHFTQRDESLLK